jgi:hypothetical protein
LKVARYTSELQLAEHLGLPVDTPRANTQWMILMRPSPSGNAAI